MVEVGAAIEAGGSISISASAQAGRVVRTTPLKRPRLPSEHACLNIEK